MKKIITLTCIVLFVCTIEGFAQRCLPKQWGVELSGGWGDGYPLLKKRNLDYFLGLAFFRYSQNQNKWFAGMEYTEKHFCYKCNTVPVSLFLLPVGYWYNLLSNRSKSLFFNLGGSLLIGYESINWGVRSFCDGASLKDANKFVGGGSMGIELEMYLTNRLMFSCRAREKILFNSIKTFRFQYSISIKFIIK